MLCLLLDGRWKKVEKCAFRNEIFISADCREGEMCKNWIQWTPDNKTRINETHRYRRPVFSGHFIKWHYIKFPQITILQDQKWMSRGGLINPMSTVSCTKMFSTFEKIQRMWFNKWNDDKQKTAKKWGSSRSQNRPLKLVGQIDWLLFCAGRS